MLPLPRQTKTNGVSRLQAISADLGIGKGLVASEEMFFQPCGAAREEYRCRGTVLDLCWLIRLNLHGLKVDLTPAEYRSEAVLHAISKNGNVRGLGILLPHADIGRELIAEELRKQGAHCPILGDGDLREEKGRP